MSAGWPLSEVIRTLSRHRPTAEFDPGCVKTHTAKTHNRHIAGGIARSLGFHTRYPLRPLSTEMGCLTLHV